MSHFNNIRRKWALTAADPLTGAVAGVLLREIAEPGWKSDGKRHLSSLNVELFAQNCCHVCALTSPSRPLTSGLREGARRCPLGAGAAHPRSVQLLPGWTDQREQLSLKRIFL